MSKLKTYSIANDTANGVVDMTSLSEEISATTHVVGFDGLEVNGDNLSIIGASINNEIGLDQVVNSHSGISLDNCKKMKFESIDNRTAELIAEGFLYASKTFSLSSSAQTNILALDNSRLDPAITYPIKYNTIDDNDVYELIDADDVHSMYLTALAVKKGHLDSGTALKDQVRAATTNEECDAVVDNR